MTISHNPICTSLLCNISSNDQMPRPSSNGQKSGVFIKPGCLLENLPNSDLHSAPCTEQFSLSAPRPLSWPSKIIQDPTEDGWMYFSSPAPHPWSSQISFYLSQPIPSQFLFDSPSISSFPFTPTLSLASLPQSAGSGIFGLLQFLSLLPP